MGVDTSERNFWAQTLVTLYRTNHLHKTWRISWRLGPIFLTVAMALTNTSCTGLVNQSSSASSPSPSALQIATSTLAAGQVGSAYQTTISASGGTAPYAWTIPSGSLPGGLLLGAPTGVISGTPAASGYSSFTAQVKDATGNTATKLLSISIAAAGSQPLQPTLTSITPNSGVVGNTVAVTLVGTNFVSGATISASPGITINNLTVVSATQITANFVIASNAATGAAGVTVTTSAGTSGSVNFTVDPVNATFDQYGGRINLPCAKATGWFHTEKINTRWWLCTPLGNAYFLEGVGAWTYPGAPNWSGSSGIITSKYSNSANVAAASTIDEFQSWNFNAVGEFTFGLLEPISACQGCTKLPEIQTITVSNYAAANLWNYAQRPMKNLLWGLNSHYGGWRASIMDFYEPQFGVWLDGLFTQNSGFTQYAASPYFVGVMLDDTDWFWGMGAGPDFHTFPEGHTNSHVGYMVLITSPVQTYNVNPASRGISEVYADTKIYSKTAMPNPPATCSIQTPCSLRDYLFNKYNGSIAALNAAWGSNYTTFDSSGTQVAGEVIGTGDGTTTSFSHTLAHVPASPESVQVLINGVLAGGDCPWFTGACGVVQNTGGLGGPTLANSTVNYTSGQLMITFSAAPASGASVTANYIVCGWTCGTGLMDEDGRNTAWVGTNAICLTPALACDGTDNPLPNANANLGADLDAWIAQFAGQYFGTLSTHLKKAAPNMLYFGADTVGTWSAPPRKGILEGAAPYVDGLFTQWFGNLPDATTGQQMYSFLTQYLGDKPLINFMTLNAQPDSAMSSFPADAGPTFATQPLRGQQWNTTVSDMLNTPSFNNTFQWVGVVWWGSHDFTNAEKTDWGLKTPFDNAYDGHESVTATVACSSPLQSFSCGGEANNYGDLITPVKSANQLWLNIP